jgi:hypothetical integral membrane protein (TIGR02206 family)
MTVPRTVVDTGRFEAYGASHWAALGVLAAGIVVLVALGGRRNPAAGERLGRRMAVVIVAITVPLQALYFTPAYWNIARTLPLQLCDVASVVAVVALWTRRRWAAALTYYWGLTLTTQAILTPDLAADFPDPVFLLYWAMHVLVVWAAVHLAWGLGLAPGWREYRLALAATVAWAAVVYAVNTALGTNYGYLNAKPAAASVLDLLGPWPWYLLAEAGLVTGVWALITWPWARRPDPPTGRSRPARWWGGWSPPWVSRREWGPSRP